MTPIDAPAADRRGATTAGRRRCPGDGPCDGLVVFGNVDWWYHNRGHSSTRVAARLAGRVPTLYVNSIGMRLPVPGRTEIAWRRYGRKLRSLARGLRRDPASGLWVATPLFVPRYSLAWLEFNGRLLAAQVRALRRRLGMRRPSALVAMPTMTPAVERLPWARVVFERCDDFAALPEADTTTIAALERRLLALCDHAAYVSPELLDRDRGLSADARLVGHGVDLESAAAARPPDKPRPAPPEALRGLPRPIVGFSGALDDYRIDLGLLIAVARHVAPGTLVLIGPEQMDLSRIKAEPNVRLVGQVPPDRLLAHVAHFDAAIIPFLSNDFNRRSSPIKLKEYLALGLPVVATDLPAYRPYAGLVHTADSQAAFLDALDRALTESDPALSRRRRSAVASDDWGRVAARYAGMLACPGSRDGDGDGDGDGAP